MHLADSVQPNVVHPHSPNARRYDGTANMIHGSRLKDDTKLCLPNSEATALFPQARPSSSASLTTLLTSPRSGLWAGVRYVQAGPGRGFLGAISLSNQPQTTVTCWKSVQHLSYTEKEAASILWMSKAGLIAVRHLQPSADLQELRRRYPASSSVTIASQVDYSHPPHKIGWLPR